MKGNLLSFLKLIKKTWISFEINSVYVFLFFLYLFNLYIKTKEFVYFLLGYIFLLNNLLQKVLRANINLRLILELKPWANHSYNLAKKLRSKKVAEENLT